MNKENIPPIGNKVIITVIGYFGNNVVLEGVIEKEPYQHGYNFESGGWGLYDTSKHGIKCVPAYKFGFRQKGKRKIMIINCEDVIEIDTIG